MVMIFLLRILLLIRETIHAIRQENACTISGSSRVLMIKYTTPSAVTE